MMKLLGALGKTKAEVCIDALGLRGHYLDFQGAHSPDKGTLVQSIWDKN